MNDAPQLTRPTVYPTAVDLWVLVLILLAPAIAIAFGVMLLRQGRPADAMTLLFIGGGLLLVTGLFTCPCRYTILEDTLSIRCGVVFYQIPLSEVERVERSASLRSAPALSIRRVLVQTQRRKYLVSPKNRDQFISDLQSAIN